MDELKENPGIQSDWELVDLFRRASRLMARNYHKRDHFRHAQSHILSIIRERGAVNQSELLEILDVRSSSLSEVLRKLERNGQIVRRKSDEDRRSYIIESKDKDDNPDSADKQNSEGFFACLEAHEREQFGNILEKLIRNMKDSSEDKDMHKGRHSRGRGHHHRSGHGKHGHERGKSPGGRSSRGFRGESVAEE